jgi:hypothetical protein
MHLSQWPWEPNRLPDFSPARPPQAPFPATDLRTMIGLRRFRLERPLELAFNDSLIQALGELNYAPAAELLLPELGGASHVAAVTALKRLSPERLENALLTTACDRQADSGRRALALMTLSGLPAKARVRELLPLLDETTALITDPRGSSWNWRLCDHAAAVMAKLLDWELPNLFTEPTRRDELIKRLREWSATKP